jgi:hypothetical protein
MMPVTVRMSYWREGHLLREPTLLTAIGLRETLLAALDYDEARVNFVCKQIEDTGLYELGDLNESTTIIEKILHS